MKRSTLGGAVALLASTAVISAGLTTNAASAAPSVTPSAESAGPVAPVRVLVSIDAKRVLKIPATVSSGLHAFAVSSARTDDSQLQMVVPKAGYTRLQFIADYDRAFNRGSLVALNRLQDNVTWLGGAEAFKGLNGNVKVSVPESGKIWAFDFFATTLSTTKLATVTIGGTPGPTDAVSGDATVTATAPYAWSDTPTTIPTSGNLVLDNQSGVNTDLELFKLAPGATIEDFDQWIDDVNSGGQAINPPLDFRYLTYTGTVSGGVATANRYALPAGDYVLLAGWPDEDGVSRMYNGMYRAMTLSDAVPVERSAAPAPARDASATHFVRWMKAHR